MIPSFAEAFLVVEFWVLGAKSSLVSAVRIIAAIRKLAHLCSDFDLNLSLTFG